LWTSGTDGNGEEEPKHELIEITFPKGLRERYPTRNDTANVACLGGDEGERRENGVEFENKK
jgi:hypothetical protein